MLAADWFWSGGRAFRYNGEAMLGNMKGKAPGFIPIVLGLAAAAAAALIAGLGLSFQSIRPAPPAGDNLIDDGGFEGDPRSFPFLPRPGDPGGLFLQDEFSRGPGEYSLFIDASRIDGIPADGGGDPAIPAPQAVLRRPLPGLSPGAAYLLSFWIARDRNIDGVYPTAVLGGRAFRLSDFWTAGRWQKISLIAVLPRLLPPDLRVLEIRIPAGDYRLWIDDLVLRRIAPDLRAVRTTPGGRALEWTVPSSDRLFDFRLVLSRGSGRRAEAFSLWTDNAAGDDWSRPPPGWAAAGIPESPAAKFAAARVEKTVFDPVGTIQRPWDEKKDDPSASGLDRFRVRLEDLAASLPPGRWRARIEAYQYRTLLASSAAVPLVIPDGRTAGPTAARPREAPPDAPESAAAAADSLLDFFPVGIYGARPEDFAALAEAGFDAAVFTAPGEAALVAAAAEADRAGLRLMISPPAKASVPDKAAWFYLADEPEGRSVSPKLLRAKQDALRRLGLVRPGAIALCRSWRIPDYAPAADIFMSDPYPVPFEPLSWLSECLDEIGRTVAGDPAKRVWAVIQAFGWSVHPQVAGGRPPTPAELKTLVRLALLHGADGLFFFTLRGGNYRLQDDPPLWQAVQEAAAEARRLKPLFDAPDLFPGSAAPDPDGTSPSPETPVLDCLERDAYGLPVVHFAVKRPPDGPPVLLALNTVDRPVRASLRPPGLAAPVSIVLEPLEFKISSFHKDF